MEKVIFFMSCVGFGSVAVTMSYAVIKLLRAYSDYKARFFK